MRGRNPMGIGRGSFVTLLVCVSQVVSCGGGGGGRASQITVGPNAILNGGSASTANSHWSSNCFVQVELAANGDFRFAVTDTSGTTFSGGGTWTASGTDSATMNSGAPGLQGFFVVTSLTQISGSTSSGHFTAGVIVANTNGQQNLGTCSFTLQNGVIP